MTVIIRAVCVESLREQRIIEEFVCSSFYESQGKVVLLRRRFSTIEEMEKLLPSARYSVIAVINLTEGFLAEYKYG
jgi:hypothetical protein